MKANESKDLNESNLERMKNSLKREFKTEAAKKMVDKIKTIEEAREFAKRVR